MFYYCCPQYQCVLYKRRKNKIRDAKEQTINHLDKIVVKEMVGEGEEEVEHVTCFKFVIFLIVLHQSPPFFLIFIYYWDKLGLLGKDPFVQLWTSKVRVGTNLSSEGNNTGGYLRDVLLLE